MQTVKSQIENFCDCLFEPEDIVEARILKSGVSKFYQAKNLSQGNGELKAENERGQNIYIGANPRKQIGGTTDADVQLARCLFVDFDHITPVQVAEKLGDFPIPTITINSGHGVHCYWRLVEPIRDTKVWRQLQKRLIKTLDSDKSIHNPSRIMRLIGYENVKNPDKPVSCCIVESDSARKYLLADIEENLEVLPSRTQSPVSNTPATNTGPLDKIGRAALYAAKWPPATEGSRNNETFRHAATLLKDFSLSETEAFSILSSWNSGNTPPLTDEELRKIIISGEKYGTHAEGEKLTQTKAQKKPLKVALDRKLQYRTASTIKPKTIKYLQPEIIPLGHITNIVSQEEAGKSVLSNSIAAIVSTGSAWTNAPQNNNPKGDVIIFTHEESPEEVAVPRLIANGADLDRIHFAENIVTKDGTESFFDIEYDIPVLDTMLDIFPRTRLVIFDPINSYSSCNENSNREVRQALKPLIDFAVRKGIAVLALTHLNKKIDIGYINRTIGSRAWSAVPRMSWGIRVEQVEDDTGDKTDTGYRFLLNIKCNLGRRPKGLKFSIEDGGKVIYYTDRVSMSMDDSALKTNKIIEATEWLGEKIGTGSITSKALFEAGEDFGFNEKLLRKAGKNLNVDTKTIEYGGLSFWTLPEGDDNP